MEVRQTLCDAIKQLNPIGFLLCEPSSDHNNIAYAERFKNCWDHFSLIFDALNNSGLRDEEISLLKLNFFGREIEDIVGKKDEFRTERHESAATWLNRLEKSNFQCRTDFQFLHNNIHKFSTGDITTVKDKSYIGIEWDNTIIVSVIFAC